MDVLFILIPVSIALASAAVIACLVAIRGGQYDDVESPRWRMLFDGQRSDGRRSEGGNGKRLENTMSDVSELIDDVRDDETPDAKARRSDPL